MNRDERVQGFRRRLDRDLELLIKAGLKQETLTTLAEALQSHLADYWTKKICCAQSLEVMMRAVTAIIEGNPEMGTYIAEKWRFASTELPKELSKKMPKFAKAMR